MFDIIIDMPLMVVTGILKGISRITMSLSKCSTHSTQLKQLVSEIGIKNIFIYPTQLQKTFL